MPEYRIYFVRSDDHLIFPARAIGRCFCWALRVLCAGRSWWLSTLNTSPGWAMG